MNDNLYKKYKVRELSAGLDDAYESDDEAWEARSIEASTLVDAGFDVEGVQLATNVQGRPNVEYIGGLPINKDEVGEFNFMARGVQGSPGVYWQTYVSDGLDRSSVDSGYEGLISGQWTVQAHERTPDELLERTQEQIEWVREQILDRTSQWDDVLKAWNWGDKVFGFMLWEIIDTEDGGLKALEPRMPNRIKKWLFSEDGREWVGAEFSYLGEGNDVIIPAADLLLYSTGVGLDLEGHSKQRAVTRWVEIKQLVTQIEVATDESHGAGYIFVTPTGPYEDRREAEKIVEVLKKSTGRDTPIIKVGEGYAVEWLSPNGKLPNFESLRSYCDNQIALALQSTGSLVGLGSTGSYALADVKDAAENIRRTRLFGKIVCKWISEFLIPRLINNHFGGPVARGLFPRLSFALANESKDPGRYTTIASLVSAGVLTWSRGDENQLRDELDLAQLVDDPEEAPDEASYDPEMVYKITNAISSGAIAPTGGLIRYIYKLLGAPEPTDEEVAASIAQFEYDKASGGGGSFSTPHSHTHSEMPETLAERAIRLGNWIPREREILLSYDPSKLSAWVMKSNVQIGKAVQKVARLHRDEYVLLTSGESEYRALKQISTRLQNKYMREYTRAIGYELNRLAIKGSASQLRELGALKAEPGSLALPSVPKDVGRAAKKYSIKPFSDAFFRHIEMQADRIATHAYNVTASYLENNAVSESQAAGAGAKKPQIPTASAYSKHARNYTMRTFNFGREQVIERVQQEAEALGIAEQRVVMEFSSIMEMDRSCEPCMNNDGRRYFLGSAEYDRDKPPYYKHQGPADTCLCLMNAILPAQSGYEKIVDDLLNGGSKVDSGLMDLSNSRPELKGFAEDPLIALSVLALSGA